MNEETRDYVRQWILKAQDDLIVIAKLTDSEIIATSAICFHCQQVAEKFLKAFLIAHDLEIKKTHNIEFLLSECATIDLEFSSIDPKDLSDYGVDIRYPGDLYIPDKEEAIEHKNIALKIKDLVEKKLIPLF